MKDSSSRRKQVCFITFSIVLTLVCSQSAVKAQICGDADNNGSVNAGDGTFIFKYLVLDGLAPPNFSDADFDGFAGISIYECRFNGSYIGQGGLAPICPPIEPKLVAEPNSELLLVYNSLFPANQDTFDVSIRIISPFTYTDGYIFPLRIRVDGQIPEVLSTVEDDCPVGITICGSRIVADSGIVLTGLFAHWSADLDSGGNEIVKIKLTVPQSNVPRPIDISWTILSPINAPAPDSSLYPLFLRKTTGVDVEGHLPTLTPRCCASAGDADFNTDINIGDATFIVKYIFQSGDAPPCLDAADADGGNDVNIGDATHLVKFIFQGGEFPVCGTTGQ